MDCRQAAVHLRQLYEQFQPRQRALPQCGDTPCSILFELPLEVAEEPTQHPVGRGIRYRPVKEDIISCGVSSRPRRIVCRVTSLRG